MGLRPEATATPDLQVRVFADGADEAGIAELARHPLISGFTTNPTLMRAAGVPEYEGFARRVLELVPDLPISFEVFADDFDEMERQARRIAAWGDNVNVKIPITDTNGVSTDRVMRSLAADGIRLNVVQADAIGCHVITVTHDILRKLPLLGRDLAEFSLDTVRMFHRDAQAAGFEL